MKPLAKPRSKVCVECGAGFESIGKRMVCSDYCAKARNARKSRGKYQASKRDYGSKKCVVCNKRFKLSRPNQKVCSDECSVEWGREKARIYSKRHANKKKEPMPERITCPQCKKRFKPTHRSRKFCSDKCAHRNHVERKRANKPIPIVSCQVCGIEFEQRHGGRKYCSEKCAYTVILAQQAAWRAENVREDEDYEPDLWLWDDGSNDNYWLDEEWQRNQGKLNRIMMLLPPIGPMPEWASRPCPQPDIEPKQRAGQVIYPNNRVLSRRELFDMGIGVRHQIYQWTGRLFIGIMRRRNSNQSISPNWD